VFANAYTYRAKVIICVGRFTVCRCTDYRCTVYRWNDYRSSALYIPLSRTFPRCSYIWLERVLILFEEGKVRASEEKFPEGSQREKKTEKIAKKTEK